MALVDIPVPTATASVNAVLLDPQGNPPNNVIHKDDLVKVRATVNSGGVMFDTARLRWEFTLRIEGNPASNVAEAPDRVLGPVTILHNGTPGGSPYSNTVDINIPPGTLAVPNGKSQSYEFTLELVAVDDLTGQPHGMAGFIDLAEVLVYAGPNS